MIRYGKLVMYGDLNCAGRLFGGKMLAWVDEAAAMYAMCQLRTQRVVTLKFSESLFKEPVSVGDFLEFDCQVIEFGKSSITVGVTVETKDIKREDKRRTVFTASVKLVAVGEDNRPMAHGVTEIRT